MADCPRCSSALPELAQVCPFCGEVLNFGTVPGIALRKDPAPQAFDQTVQGREGVVPHAFRHSPEALTSTVPGRTRRGRTAPLGPHTPAVGTRRGGTKVGLPRAEGSNEAPPARQDPGSSRQQTWMRGTPGASAMNGVSEHFAPPHAPAREHPPERGPSGPPASARGRVRERHDLALRPSAFPSRPHAGRLPQLRWIGAAALVLACLLVGASIFYLTGRRDLDLADCEVDESGNTRLVLTCPTCDDGSIVRFGTAAAQIVAGRAVLSLGGSLPPGRNAVTLQLEEPGGSPLERSIQANVPFLVKTDFRLLSEARPQAELVVHALPRSAVIVEGQAVTLDPFGVGRQAVDLSSDLTGASTETVRLERRVSYTVTTPDGRAYRSNLVVQLPITPLSVEAPGPGLTTEHSTFTLAGRTHADATLTVQGRPIAVDSKGLFAQLMNISAPGETVIAVRASLPDFAPRLFSIHIHRVESLRAEADRLRPLATRAYKDLLTNSEAKAGWQVALRGRVLGVTAKSHLREIEFEPSPCSEEPCVLRITHAGTQSIARGQAVEVFGHVLRSASPGDSAPTIEADFFLDTDPTP